VNPVAVFRRGDPIWDPVRGPRPHAPTDPLDRFGRDEEEFSIATLPTKMKIYTSHTRIRVLRAMLYMMEWFAVRPCIDCGETNPLKLQADHVQNVCYRSKERRRRHTSTLVVEGNLARLKKELALCVSRCASCHFKRHLVEVKSYRTFSIADIRNQLEQELFKREGIKRLVQAGWNIQRQQMELREASQRSIRLRRAEQRRRNSPVAHRKITMRAARKIRAKYVRGVYGVGRLAREFGLCAHSIRNIISNRTYREN
jgi:hypothetical protein